MKNRNTIQPKLSLVGAGPGDPELITLKGLQTLQQADVVLYDALVNTELLNHLPESVPRFYVGKRKGQHAYTQDQINSLIVDSAFTYGHVVRLKGGDPFVFGRGQEELLYAELFNIETALVPGISSALAVPALQGIPLTHRGSSEGFWVITGTKSDRALAEDLKLAAHSNSTVVVLMGLAKLKEITAVFAAAGKGELPVAVLVNGSLPKEQTILGTVDTIVELFEAEESKGPGIIVLGEVVKQHSDFPMVLTDWKYLLN